MRLWTIQPQEVYDLIIRTGTYRCDGERSDFLDALGSDAPYRWMAAQMARRVDPPPEGVVFPVWAWHTMYWEHRRPDMRKTEFRSQKRPFVLLEIEIPDENVLLSDEELWHVVLNDCYLIDARNEAEFDEAWRRFEQLPEAAQSEVKERSWERIFDVSPPTNDGWLKVGDFIQATFWELRREQIVKVWRFE